MNDQNQIGKVPYFQASGQRLFTLAGRKPGFITGSHAGGVHLRA